MFAMRKAILFVGVGEKMKIAIISDIHGNYQALKRCLEDSISQDVDAYIWLGDYLGEFPYPQDTMKTLYNMQTRYPCYFLRGNKEDYWINRRKDTFCDWKDGNHSIMAMIYTYENLKAEDIDFFESLPISQSIRFDGMEPILVCHGTPFANNKKLLSNDESLTDIIGQCSEKYIICGHTHSQGLVYDGEKKVINAGAVGVPLKSPQKTQYLILESVGKEWKSNYQSLEYDISNVIEDMHKSGLWDMSPYWCKITEHLLYTGEISHGTVLNHVMRLNEYKEPWYNIAPVYWEKALLELGIM